MSFPFWLSESQVSTTDHINSGCWAKLRPQTTNNAYVFRMFGFLHTRITRIPREKKRISTSGRQITGPRRRKCRLLCITRPFKPVCAKLCPKATKNAQFHHLGFLETMSAHQTKIQVFGPRDGISKHSWSSEFFGATRPLGFAAACASVESC